MFICTQKKFNEIQSIAYLVMVRMVEDGINYFNSSNQRAIPALLLRISLQTVMCITTTWSYILGISFTRFNPLLIKLWLGIEKIVEI